jgi:peptide/nickel transport system substrate-binding protein
VSGGTATVLAPSELRTLDPALTGNNGPSGAVIGNALYGTLLINDPVTGEIKPSMATAFTTTDGGATFELTLRDGLVFSDGTPLDATAVKTNWDRMRDPATGSVYRSDASLIATTEVAGPTTLKVTMAEPVPNYAYSVITTSMNWIASPAALAKGAQAFDAAPVGAGPFTLKEWRRQDAMDLVRNPKYWDAPRPYLDALTVKPATDASQRLNTIISGGADVAVETSWQNLKKAADQGLPSNLLSLSGGNYVALNTRRAPFDDPRAREAVVDAIDPQALNVSAFNGTAQLVDTLFSDSSPLHTDQQTAAPDKAKAQQLFDQLAAEGKPVAFTFTSTSSTESRSQAEAMQAQLSAYKNVSMQIKTVDFAQIPALQNTHDFDATVSSAAFVDPDPRLWTAFSGKSPVNMSGVDDPELNAALDKGRTATAVSDRKAAYQVVQDRLVALHPLLWLTRFASGAVSIKEAGGLTQYGFGSLLPEQIWLQK